MFGLSMDFYPVDMLNEFKNIELTVGGSPVSVSVNRYRNNDAANYPTATKGGTQDALSIKDALMSLGSKDVLTRCGGASAYVGVFVGKGSPEAIAAVMTTLYDYSDKFIKTFGKAGGVRGKVAKWLADDNLSWQETLQNVANEVVGLDCNGFVGNWLKRHDHALKIGPNTRPRDVYDKRRVVRKTVDEIEGKDVIVWANYSHIAAVDWPAGAGRPKFDICQSAGGGPRVNEYTIKPVGNGTFRLYGGIPQLDVAGPVHIFAL